VLGPSIAGGLLAFLAVVVGSVLLGLAGGLLWAHLAPRAVYVVVSRGTAEVVNPETSAFIAADGWFCVMAVAGGIVSGLLGYLLAVRRYGALPMLGVLGGGLAAAYAAMKLGQQTGRAQFYRLLASSKAGEQLRAPVSLGAHEALAFWPLAAGLVAGGIEAIVLLRRRNLAQRTVYPPGHNYGSARPAGLTQPGGYTGPAGYRDSAAAPGQGSPGWPTGGEPRTPGRHSAGADQAPGEPRQPGESPWPGEPPGSGGPPGPGGGL
jgi:hypothetical protein